MRISVIVSNWLARAALVVLAVVLVACGGPTRDAWEEAPTTKTPAARVGAAARPAGVPEEFVFTPNGFFHPSCVIQVADGERVRRDGSIARADGSIRTLPGCAHPRYDKHGRVVTQDAALPRAAKAEHKPFAHEWVVWGDNSSHGNLAFIQAQWTVPAEPLFDLGQTYFYFPGLEDSQAIVQPVLQYNQVGTPFYTISSWFCCLKGYTWQSSTVYVDVGDTILGTVSGSFDCSGLLGCGEWTITTNDLTLGRVTQLVTEVYFSGMQNAVGGALEAYNIGNCDEYSMTHSVTFFPIAVETTAGTWPSMSWWPQATAALPQCGYQESSTGTNNVTLTVANNGEP